ncbi:MAG: hypothetical protein WCK35_16205 [Chloroflexota bacterium]
MQPLWKSHIVKQMTGPDDPEFQTTLQDALGQVLPMDVIEIADELVERQTRLFVNLKNDLAESGVPSTDVFSAVTHSKANARILLSYFSDSDLARSAVGKVFDALLNGEAHAAERIAVFVEKLGALEPRLALELATGLLNNTDPQQHWLWTRWLWDPTSGTGALPLLAGSTYNLARTGSGTYPLANSLADGYIRVGAVTAMSIKFGEVTGLFTPELLCDEKRALFANSAFLACVYSVYLYGTTSWRLSREFNRLLPTLPGMARRLLGLKKTGSATPLDQIKETNLHGRQI